MKQKRAVAGVLSASIACAGLVWGSLASQAGCSLQQCATDGGSLTLTTSVSGYQPTIQNGVWQSAPLDGPAGWISLPGQAEITIKPTFDDGGPLPGPYIPYALVSADPNPANSNFAPSAGNITEFTNDGANSITVFNDTCSQYYLWLSLTPTGQEPTVTPPPLDASADGPTSAASDASPDASPAGASGASMTSSDASNADATGD